MFIIWGKKAKDQPAGMVADRCPTCGTVTAFKITNHYSVSHVYYIPLGSGQLINSSMTCASCGTKLLANPSQYATTIGINSPSQIPLEELLQRTNPRLAQATAQRAQLEAIAGGTLAPGAAPPPLPWDRGRPPEFSPTEAVNTSANEAQARAAAQMKLAMTKLDDCHDGETKAVLMTRLGQWPSLDAAQQSEVLSAVEELRQTNEDMTRTISFIQTIAEGLSTNVGCFPALVVLAVPIIGIVATPALQSWLWGPLLIMGGLAIGLYVYIKISNYHVRKWTRRTLIPQLQRQSIKAEVFLGLLASIKESKQGSEKVKNLATEMDTIGYTLLEAGILNLNPKGSNSAD
jgi:hypothetical protein